jgi:hypothetical protein
MAVAKGRLSRFFANVPKEPGVLRDSGLQERFPVLLSFFYVDFPGEYFATKPRRHEEEKSRRAEEQKSRAF